MNTLQLEHISYLYSAGTPYEMRALDDVSLTIRGGTVTGLIGHTGSGKSTLVQLLNGLNRPTEGRVLMDGVDIWEKPKEIARLRYRVGLVMQYPEYQLFEETVRADIAYGPKNMGLSPEEVEARVLEAAAFAGISPEMLDQSPFDLSGGQKRRAAIAGIMAMRPEVLVLDEPAAGLDPQGRDEILGGIRAYREKSGSTVIIVSHSMEDMARYCDELIVMADAKLFMQGSCEEIFSHPEELAAVGLDVPQITRVAQLLRKRGLALPESIYTVEQAAAALRRLMGGEGK
ncbi:MAG: energy-coupling factor transporter ATPase [Ruminococcaceae bacterium]|nr:energy-coupling factor transporter ATPase [Oscillospiraceae bacterium]